MRTDSSRQIPAFLQRSATCGVILLLLTAAFLFAPAAQAQYRASIQGVVADSTGAVIPGVTLTLVNDSTSEKQVRTSNAEGIFNFNALPPDTFTLTVEKDGFQKQVLSKVQVIADQPNAVNVQLAVGAAAQTVSVDASLAPSLETTTASVGGADQRKPDSAYAIVRSRCLSAHATCAGRIRRWRAGIRWRLAAASWHAGTRRHGRQQRHLSD